MILIIPLLLATSIEIVVAEPFKIPLKYNKTSGFLTAKSSIGSQGQNVDLLVTTDGFRYLAAFSSKCPDDQCPGNKVTLDPSKDISLDKAAIEDIFWRVPSTFEETIYVGSLYNMNICPTVTEGMACAPADVMMIDSVSERSRNASTKTGFDGFLGLCPEPQTWNSTFAKQMLSYQTSKYFALFIPNTDGEVLEASLEVGQVDYNAHADQAATFDPSSITWHEMDEASLNDFQWQIPLQSANLIQSTIKHPILDTNEQYRLLISTQQKDMSVPDKVFQNFVQVLKEYGATFSTDSLFECNNDLLRQLPDLELIFGYQAQTIGIPWQGYAERLTDNQCLLRLNNNTLEYQESNLWVLGTWTLRQFYTIYHYNDQINTFSMSIVDSSQKSALNWPPQNPDTPSKPQGSRSVLAIVVGLTITMILLILGTICLCKVWKKRRSDTQARNKLYALYQNADTSTLGEQKQGEKSFLE